MQDVIRAIMFVMKACFCIIIRFNSQHRIAYFKKNACHKCGWAKFSWPIPHIYCIYYYNHLACEFGYYGLGCNQECSTFCKKSRYCNSISGHCKDGCKSGWQGLDCLEVSKLTVTEKKLTSEFNGILSAFCILVFLNGVVIAHFLVKRFRNSKAKLPAINQSNIAQNGCESEISNVYINDNDRSEYQELGEISKLETYDTLQDVPNKQFLWHVFFLVEEMMVFNVKM